MKPESGGSSAGELSLKTSGMLHIPTNDLPAGKSAWLKMTRRPLSKWSMRLGRWVALFRKRTGEERIYSLPLTSDITKFSDHLKTRMTECMKALEESTPDSVKSDWRDLAEVLLVYLIVFNRRRVTETSQMTLEDVQRMQERGPQPMDEELVTHPLEKAMLSIFRRVVVRGKYDNLVPVLFAPLSYKALQVLLKHRSRAGIASNNPYVFALTNKGSREHIRGDIALRLLAEACPELQNPAALYSGRLRKHVATHAQALSVSASEKTELCRMMGHGDKVHFRFYEHVSHAQQTGRFSRFLLALEQGSIQVQRGSTLTDLQFDWDSELLRGRPLIAETDGTMEEDLGSDEECVPSVSGGSSLAKQSHSAAVPLDFERSSDSSANSGTAAGGSSLAKQSQDAAMPQDFERSTDSSANSGADSVLPLSTRKEPEKAHAGGKIKKKGGSSLATKTLNAAVPLDFERSKDSSANSGAAAALPMSTTKEVEKVHAQKKMKKEGKRRPGWSEEEKKAVWEYFFQKILNKEPVGRAEISKVEEDEARLKNKRESSRSEMAQEEFDPLDLMSGVAMLVLEARTPDNSVKGRVEGPHCPSVKKSGRHMCSKETLECLRALEFRERINLMWKNGIPSCIDILLFPACSHGQDEARSLEGIVGSIRENSILLERWSIQCIQKWHGEWSEGVSGSMLLQAVRSYLYFSQLSSWLTSMHGCLPITIAYRLYAPGEEAGVNFVQPPDSHSFPTGIYGPHGLKVHVLALPRQEHVPALLCALAGEKEEGLGVAGAFGDGMAAESVEKKQPRLHRGSHPDQLQQPREPNRQKTRAGDSQNSSPDQQFSSEPASTSTRPPHAVARESSSGEPPTVAAAEPGGFAGGGARVKGQRSSSRERLEGQLRPLELSDTSTAAQSLDLHSPKVLMSADVQVPNVLVTKKQHLDFKHAGGRDTDDPYPYSAEEKFFLARRFQDFPSPLSPLDFRAFLANLQSISGPIPQNIKLPPSVTDELLLAKSGMMLDGASLDLHQQELNRGRARRGFGPHESAWLTAAQEPPWAMPAHEDQAVLRSLLPKKPLPCPSDSSTPNAAAVKGKFLPGFEYSPNSSDVQAPHSFKDVKPQSQKDRCQKNDGFSLKEDWMAVAQKWSESAGKDGELGEEETRQVLESKAIKKRKALGLDEADKNDAASGYGDVGFGRSIDQTLRDINKIIRARKTKSIDQDFPESQQASHILSMGTVVSSSWSSSSSSSSTYSSSPKVCRGLLDEGDRNSGSSTPTNRRTPPLPQQSRDQPVQTKIESAQHVPRNKIDEDEEMVTPENSQTSKPFSSTASSTLLSGRCSGDKWLNSETDLKESNGLISSDRRDFETPELQNGALPEGPAKRKLAFGNDATPTLVSLDNMGSISQKHLDTPETDQNLVVSSPCDASSNQSHNIPQTWNLQSLQKAVESLEDDSCHSLQSHSERREKTVKADKHSQSASSQTCDQTKSEVSSSSKCNFYLENSLSPSPSVSSFENGAVTSSQSLSDDMKSKVKDDCHVQAWQQMVVEKPKDDQSSNKPSVPNRRQEQWSQSVQQDVSDALDSEEYDSNQCDSSSVQTNGFGNDSVKNSFQKFQESPPTSYHNGAVHSNDLDTVDKDSDKVFKNEEEVLEDKRHQKHFPTRAKSAPNFMNARNKMSREADNETSDVITRGRLATREKPHTDMTKGAGPQERLRHQLVKSASMMFSSRSGLPSQSSPAPVKRRSTGRFDYDETLTSTKAIKNALSMSRLPDVSQYSSDNKSASGRVLSTSAPASTNSLLGNFEESILNGRIEPAGVVDGFAVDIGASGSFCPRHLSLPVTAYFFHLSDDNAPSPYLGHISLEDVGKKGYHIPRKGTLQVTLFNPNKTVVKMFVVMYDLADMPPDSQTVIRQRTVYMPVEPDSDEPSYLRYLIHLRVASSSSGKIYLHTDIRLIFARNKFELDSSVAKYELRSFTETPVNPKYSRKR